MSKVDERIERLIVRGLDGEATQAEQLELDRELIRSPEARALLESYRWIDALSAEVLEACATRRMAGNLLLPAAAPATPRRSWRRNWMVYASALAACLAVMVLWQTPDVAPRVGTDDRTGVANGVSHANHGSVGRRAVPTVDLAGGDVGVWRVRDAPAQRLDRVTDRNLILVPAAEGTFYLLELDQVRELRQPKTTDEERFTGNPI